jgi:gliding motility-associated-like protein
MIKKYLLVLSFLFVAVEAFSQAAPLVQVTIPTPNPVCNTGDCTQLQANYNTLKQTNDYTVTPVVYNPNFPFTGGTVIQNTSDDSWTQIVNLPFTFCFYGQSYNQLLVGTNGVITFNTSGPNYTPGGACRWAYTATIPNADANFIRNAIFGVYQDTDISTGALSDDTTPNNIQNVNYYVLDTGPNAAPNRVFVANFNELPQFSCHAASGLQTSQIIIHETTNIIDVLISKRSPCLNWNSGSGLVGIQNAAGTLTRVPPGRNTGTWSATNEAWRFTPNGAITVPSSIQWFLADGVTPAAAANVNPITVCPTGPETYIAKVTYTICNGQPAIVEESVNIDVTQLPVNDPIDLVVCSSLPLPCVNLDQTLSMQTGIANPAWYDITFYDDLAAAQNAAGPPNLLLGANLTNYCLTSNPQTFYVRIEDLAVTGCVQIRPFTVSVSSSPSGTFTYDQSPYCSSLTLAQPNTPVGLTPGGTFSAVPNGTTPTTNVLSIDPTTGAITPSLSGIGTYTVNYNLAASTSCPAYAASTTVEIIACSCTVTAPSISETACIGFAINSMTFTVSGGGDSGAVTVGTLPSGISASFATGILTISGSSLIPGTYPFTVSITTGTDVCTINAQIIINGNPSQVLSSAVGTDNQSVCPTTAITPISYTITGGGTGAFSANLPTGITGAFSAGVYTITGSGATPGTYNYTVTTTGGCAPITNTGTITILNNHAIALNSAAATETQSVCVNSAITPIIYTLSGGATGATVTGLPPGVTSLVTGTTLTISGTPNTTVGSPFTYAISTTGNTCAVATDGGTITVNPTHAISLSSIASTENQSVCVNNAITPITYTLSGGATGATVTGLPTGVGATVVGTLLTISGTPSITTGSPFGYSITTTGNTCLTATDAGSITVTTDHSITLSSSVSTETQSVCINTAITAITYSLASGATGANVTGLPNGVNASVTGTTLTISGSPSVTGTFPYAITTTGNACAVATEGGSITISNGHTLTPSSAPNTFGQAVCINTAIANVTYALGGGATGATVTGLPAGVTASVTGSTLTISGTPTILTGSPFAYSITTSGNSCAVALGGDSIIVNPIHTMALTSATATETQTLCVNTPITAITYTLGGGATGANVTGLPAGVSAVVAGTTLTISGTPSTTTGSPFAYSITSTGNTCAVVTDSGSITVEPIHTLTLSSAAGSESQTLCINTAITPITYTLGGGATNATVTGLPTGITAAVTGTTLTISGSPSILTGSPFTYNITTTGNACTVATGTGSFTVNPVHTIALTSVASTEAQILCVNTAIAPITYILGGGATGANVTGLPAGVNAVVAGTTLTISGIPSTTTGSPFAYSITTTGNTCAVATESGSITVDPIHTIALTSAANENQVLCINTSITPITYTLGGGATGANVTGLPTGITAAVTGTTLTISGSPSILTGSPFTYNISTTGNTCTVATGTGSFTVNPVHTIALTSASATETQTLCVNTPITPITYTLGGGATGANVTGLPAGVSAVVAGTTLTISGTPTTTTGSPFAYSITTTGNTCAVATESGTITVNPIHTIALTSAPNSTTQTICLTEAIAPITYTIGGGASAATVTGLPAGVTATLVGSILTISGTPASITGSPFNFTLVTTGNSCLTATLNGSISVNPPATITITSLPATANQELCINSPIAPITYLVANGATNAALVPGSGSFPLGVTGIYDSTTGIYTISGTPAEAGIFNFQINTSGGCPSVPIQGSIKVNPTATIALTSATATANQSICNGAALTPIFYTIGNGALGATLTGMPAGITSSLSSGVLTISGSSLLVGTYNYTVTTFGGCSSASLTGTLEIKPNVTIALTSAPSTAIQTLCVNDPITPIQYTVGNGATGAAILSGSVPYGIVAQFNAGVLTISGTPTEYSTFHFTTTTIGGCSTASLSATLYIRSLPEFRLPQEGTICVDEFGVPNPGAIYTLDTQMDPLQYTFEWSDLNGVILGQNSSTFDATIPSTYSVKVTSIATGCSSIVSAVVSPALPPLSAIATVSAEFTDQQLVTIYVEPQGLYEYQLDGGPFQTQNYFTNLLSGFHQIVVRNACGELPAIEVRIIDYPNFFTPNNDTYNDYWNISDLADQPDAQIYIFDRFGKLIKQIQPSGFGWDGTFNGKPMPSTDYWFKIDYLNEKGDPSVFKSHFSLKR